MATKQIARSKSGKRTAESRFQRLWAEAQALASENTRIELELDALITRLDNEIRPVECEMGESIRQTVYRQLEFARKKSLLKWQREELNEWIDDHLSELMSMGLLDHALQTELARLRASELGIDLDPESDLSEVEQLERFLQEEFEDDENDDATSISDKKKYTTGDLFDEDELDDTLSDELEDTECEDELAELLRKLHADFESYQSQTETPSPETRKNPLSDAVFKRLFRQTAAALHPDKECNEDRRLEKHELMSQLLKARKQHDIVTILRLHEQHSSADSNLNSEDQQALEDVLVDYLKQEQRRLDDIIHQSPMHQMAYERFYHKKPTTVTRRINAHIKKIESRRQSFLDFLVEVKTLKSLKEILAVRYDARSHQFDWF